MRKASVWIAALLLSSGIAAAARAEEENVAAPKAAVVWPAAEIKWSENPVIKGAKIAVLWGDPKTGPYGALKTIPGGVSIGLHTHTHDHRVLVVSGTVHLSVEGGPSKAFGPGSYAFLPGGTKHAVECKPGSDCVYLEEQSGPSDIQFVGQPAPAK
jgi:quercetin dioxygenase-like cupin family protein